LKSSNVDADAASDDVDDDSEDEDEDDEDDEDDKDEDEGESEDSCKDAAAAEEDTASSWTTDVGSECGSDEENESPKSCG
jgi:hypothetical protein